MNWQALVSVGLLLASSGCSDAGDTDGSGGLESAVSTPPVIGEVVEPSDSQCQAAQFSDVSLDMAMGGPVRGGDGEGVVDSDGRLLETIVWVDARCDDRAERTMERVTVGWHELIGENPEHWSDFTIVDAIDHRAGDGLQLVTACGIDEPSWPSAVALIDGESHKIQRAWAVDRDGLSELDPMTVTCRDEALSCLDGCIELQSETWTW